MADRDSTTHRAFFAYYASESQRDQIVERFVTARDLVLRALKEKGDSLDVADLGCGAGTRSMVWSQLEHRVHGLDTSEELIALGQERADRADLKIDFRVGTVTDLPWEDEKMDVCLSIQLLEHVADWSRCLDECARVLRRGGALFLTTTNYLCLSQQEFRVSSPFDLIDETKKSRGKAIALATVRRVPPARWLAHTTTTASTWIFAVKR